jgi:rod shape-determining protein MreD
MAWVFGMLLGFAALALQATLVQHLAIAGIRPDLPLIVVVLFGMTRGPVVGTLAGFAIGLAQDLTNPAFLGLNALTKSLLGFGAGTLRSQLNANSLPLHAVVLFVAVLAHDFVYWTLFTRLALSELFGAMLFRSLPTAVYTAAVGMWLLGALGSRLGRGAHLGRPSFARR